VLLVVWAAILLWRIVQILRSYAYVRGVKRRATAEGIQVPYLARQVAVLVSSETRSPMAAGFVHPAIVLPESMLAELSDTEREHVMLHEAAHLAGYDDWTNLALRILGGVFAVHPVAVWILSQIERERKMACDDWVVARTGPARPYAESLVHLMELRHVQRYPEVAAEYSEANPGLAAASKRYWMRGEHSPCALRVGEPWPVLRGWGYFCWADRSFRAGLPLLRIREQFLSGRRKPGERRHSRLLR
jgi:beta-lactamase regulating signal transducer with metallopeptidase domain